MTAWTSTPRTWVAGEIPTATHFNENVRDFGRAFADAWTSYTPTLTASTTNPTNWTQTGYYMQAGKLVVAKFVLTAGGSMTAGSGTYRVALPVNAVTQANTPAGQVYLSTAASNYYLASAFIPAAGYATLVYPSGAGTVGEVTHAAPWTWAAGMVIAGQMMFEAA